MKILHVPQILKEISGGLHLHHKHHHRDKEEKIKEKVETMQDNVSDVYEDLALPAQLDHCHHNCTKI